MVSISKIKPHPLTKLKVGSIDWKLNPLLENNASRYYVYFIIFLFYLSQLIQIRAVFKQYTVLLNTTLNM